SVGGPTNSDSGVVTVTVVRPRLTIGRAVSPSGSLAPGTVLNYALTVTNSGTSNAAQVALVDTLPAALQFKVGSVSATLPTGVTAVLAYSKDGGATWAYAPARAARGAARSLGVALRGGRDRGPAEPGDAAGSQRQRPEASRRLVGHDGAAGHGDRPGGGLRRDREHELVPPRHHQIRPARIHAHPADPEDRRHPRRRGRYDLRDRARSRHVAELPVIRSSSGFTLVELMVAIMILTF